MEATTTLVSSIDLEALLFSIAQHEPGICIRYRTLGQLWYPNFLKIIDIQGGRTILFHDEHREKIISLSDPSRIVQFELDSRFRQFEPNFHYQVSDETCLLKDL